MMDNLLNLGLEILLPQFTGQLVSAIEDIQSS